MTKNLDAGDFTALALDYSQNRPDYCPSVLRGLVGLLEKEIKDVDFVDVGAGTGIWTRMVYKTQVKSVIAIEPNCSMRQIGMKRLSSGRSVNDIQVQLGNIKLTKFLNLVEQKTRKLNNINATYQTRAWSARRKD